VLSSILYQLQGLDILWKKNLSGLTYDFMFLNELNAIAQPWFGETWQFYKQADKHIQILSNSSIFGDLSHLKEDKVKIRSHSYVSTPKLNPKISKNGIKLLFERTQNSNIQHTWWE
jgi:hypothetical protein